MISVVFGRYISDIWGINGETEMKMMGIIEVNNDWE